MSFAFLVLLYYTLQTLHRERFADVVLIVNTLSSNCCLSMTCWGLHHCKWSTASVFALVQGGLTCYLCKIISSPTGDSVSSSILFRFMSPHSTQDKPDKANVLMSRSRHHNRLKISFIFFFMTDHFYSNMEHQRICLIVKLYGKSSLESWPDCSRGPLDLILDLSQQWRSSFLWSYISWRNRTGSSPITGSGDTPPLGQHDSNSLKCYVN